MALRRSPNRTSTPSPKHPLARRNASKFASSTETLRPVLVPLHLNLRRLPSRQFYAQKDAMRVTSQGTVVVGTKRKRTASTNENSLMGSRPLRGPGRMKRLRSASHQDYTSDDEPRAMDIDAPTSWAQSDNSDTDEDSSVEHLISDAPPRQLLRLRKDELVHLCNSAGLHSNAETLTKQEIVDSIVAARDNASLPPASSPGISSGYSSDDGNIAGDEENDALPRYEVMPNGLRRRATVNYLTRLHERPCKGRSLSMGNLLTQNSFHEGRKATRTLDARRSEEGSVSSGTRRRLAHVAVKSSRPASSSKASPSPLATRLRSRKTSADAASASATRSKGKGRQIDFEASHAEATQLNSDDENAEERDSDSTDAAEFELPVVKHPSPRRLRSRGRKSLDILPSGRGRPKSAEGTEGVRRIVPKRKAKEKIGSLKEEDDDNDEPEEEDVLRENEEEDDEEQTDGEEDREEVEEVDELISSTSPTPPPLPRGRRTPVKRRLRPRRARAHAPSSDADDEGEDDVDEGEQGGEEPGDDGDDADDSTAASDDGDDEREMTVVVEPRKLRNGKIVGEEEIVEESVDEDEDEDEGQAEEDSADLDEQESIDDEEASDSTESMDEVDLTVATAKTLVRLRRDDLVRLCETRDLEVVGTKPQLAEALLQWRDRRTHDFSSPSSTGTIRPPSTVKRRGGGRKHSRSQIQSNTPPVLLRPGHVHVDGPRTPPLSPNHADAEPELELDLESLGLEDREIPPEKLTKLEKIGSGGFKDVFIGRYKGRRVAISEFRGQLSEMDINELKLLGGFNHPNIVRFIGVSIPENTRDVPVMIVSELCANGDLFDYIRKVPPPSLQRILGMMLDIARGLEYLHLRKPSVIHRDCKSSNILITSKGTAKIADFGLAKVKQSTRSMVRSLVGTVNWQAPELWHPHPKYNYKADVFSCAMVYWEMLQWHLPNTKFPWEGMNEHAIYDIVGAKKQRPSISGLRKQWCSEIIDLIERMWTQEPQDRPTMSEVVEELEKLVH